MGKKSGEKQLGIVDTLTKEEKEAARLIVKNLEIDFDSRDFESPTIQKFFKGLQAMALGESPHCTVEDTLEPNLEELETFRPVINMFRERFFDGKKEDP